jgi:putative nucleotidyltransferase with HDIG domain
LKTLSVNASPAVGLSVAGDPKGQPQGQPDEPSLRFPELPELDFPEGEMVVFDPARHLRFVSVDADKSASDSALLPLARAVRANPGIMLIPRDEDCLALWDRYAMLPHIREHSRKVADMAQAIALRALELGVKVNADAVRAAGMLHDLGKTWSIARGGQHAQLGAAWVMRETRNAPLARAVLFHVFWPFAEKGDATHFMIMAIIYADKRTLHDGYVGLEERYADLVERYGINAAVRERILLSHQQGKRIEERLSRLLGVTLYEYTADRGRLVR